MTLDTSPIDGLDDYEDRRRRHRDRDQRESKRSKTLKPQVTRSEASSGHRSKSQSGRPASAGERPRSDYYTRRPSSAGSRNSRSTPPGSGGNDPCREARRSERRKNKPPSDTGSSTELRRSHSARAPRTKSEQQTPAASEDNGYKVLDNARWNMDRWAEQVCHSVAAGQPCALQNEHGIVRNNTASAFPRGGGMRGLKVSASKFNATSVQATLKGKDPTIPEVEHSDVTGAGLDSWHTARKKEAQEKRPKYSKKHQRTDTIGGGNQKIEPKKHREVKNLDHLSMVDLVVFNKSAQTDKKGKTALRQLLDYQKTVYDGAAGRRSSFKHELAEYEVDPEERNKPPPIKVGHPMNEHTHIFMCDDEPNRDENVVKKFSGTALPTIFLSHGLGGMAALWGADHPYVKNVQKMPDRLGITPENTRAIVCLSAHWQTTDKILVTKNYGANMIRHDYIGCPHECYNVGNAVNPEWFSVGAPLVADTITHILRAEGIPAARALRSHAFDHGVHIPLSMMSSLHHVPIVQMSIPADDGKDTVNTARTAYMIGKALRPLRKQGVLIIGSGQVVNPHKPVCISESEAFLKGVKKTVTGNPANRCRSLINWAKEFPFARQAHGMSDHLIPLLICAGAADGDEGRVTGDLWEGAVPLTHFAFGALK